MAQPAMDFECGTCARRFRHRFALYQHIRAMSTRCERHQASWAAIHAQGISRLRDTDSRAGPCPDRGARESKRHRLLDDLTKPGTPYASLVGAGYPVPGPPSLQQLQAASKRAWDLLIKDWRKQVYMAVQALKGPV